MQQPTALPPDVELFVMLVEPSGAALMLGRFTGTGPAVGPTHRS